MLVEVHMVMDFPDTSELVEQRGGHGDPKEDLEEGPKLEKCKTDHGITDPESGTSDSSFDLGEEPRTSST